MCNLYRLKKTTGEAAKFFDASDQIGRANLGSEVYPGHPGAVIVGGELVAMNWGFPLKRKGKNGGLLKPKPVNNARSDRLDSYFWAESFEERRCLIPLSGWAEAQGNKGAMTRTWMSLPPVGMDADSRQMIENQPNFDTAIFACAGVWRPSEEWGACFSMVMTNSAGAAKRIHARMPVVLAEQDYACWTQGSPADAFALCQPWPHELAIDHTEEPWVSGARRAGQPTLI